MSWASEQGSPSPLGATWIAAEQAYNFALYSKDAERVTLLLYGSQDLVNPVLSYSFDRFKNKTGPVWHARIRRHDMGSAEFYAYSVGGSQKAFQPEKVLLDPYAKEVLSPSSYDRTAAIGRGSNAGKAPLGLLCDHKMTFDWGDDRHPRHDGDLVIYEMHVRGFSMNPNSGVSRTHRGTFAGIGEKVLYLKELGITAVELMPVFEFDDTEPNYWGYMPLNFFAPHQEFASDQRRCEAIQEFREMVKELHNADIEVILDVVYNHTGEGNEQGPTLSFKGIDNESYYIPSEDPDHPYADFTGTGNTLACSNRPVRQLIVDSLRYWVREMHVDGFRFDLASVFSRKRDGSINFDDPPIFGDIAGDPDLSHVRLIAEPWEGNPAHPNYELGDFGPASDGQEACCAMPACGCPMSTSALHRSFPGIGWRQWNDRFRTTLRHFVKSAPGFVGDLMTRIYGSSDVFPDTLPESYRPYQSLNYITSHDGLTLYDLVSYNSIDSWNCGDRDGEANIGADVMTLRKRQVKNFVCLLMLSNGTPMFRAGDEFLQTQDGDPNPYNIDSAKTWLDWSRLEVHRDVFRFFQKMIAFRKDHPSLARSMFWRDDVKWYGVRKDVDWSFESHTLAYCLNGAVVGDEDLYVIINAYWEPLTFTIQEGTAAEWKRIVDTTMESPLDFIDSSTAPPLSSLDYTVQPRSIIVLMRSQLKAQSRRK